MYLAELEVIYRAVGAEALDAAVTGCIRELKFMPCIAEVRDRAGMNEKKIEASQALQAWEVVMNYLAKYGARPMPTYKGRDEHGRPIMEGAPKFTDRIAAALRVAGGLVAIEATPIEDIHFRRDDFVEAYKAWDVSINFPLQLPEPLRCLLLAVGQPKQSLGAGNEDIDATLASVSAATRIEEDAQAEKQTKSSLAKIHSALAKVHAVGSVPVKPPKQYFFHGPRTDQQLADDKAGALELEKQFRMAAASDGTSDQRPV